jgi:hypothetical protein
MIVSQPMYSMSYNKPEKLVQLIWLAGTQAMTDDDFKTALSVFAECSLQHRASGLIIDMREFKHRPGPEVQVFRDDVIVPKYVKAGVQKLAWIWPGESGDWMTEIPAGKYHNRYFDKPEQAVSWLTA